MKNSQPVDPTRQAIEVILLNSEREPSLEGTQALIAVAAFVSTECSVTEEQFVKAARRAYKEWNK